MTENSLGVAVNTSWRMAGRERGRPVKRGTPAHAEGVS